MSEKHKFCEALTHIQDLSFLKFKTEMTECPQEMWCWLLHSSNIMLCICINKFVFHAAPFSAGLVCATLSSGF
jgi:hypothetical protein